MCCDNSCRRYSRWNGFIFLSLHDACDYIVDDEVPIEIRLLTDKKYVPLYLQLLESGSEKKRDIRLVIVGKKGAGKTSLVKRLFGEVEGDIPSTNGIEIHRIKCKTKSNSSNWKKIDGKVFFNLPYLF